VGVVPFIGFPRYEKDMPCEYCGHIGCLTDGDIRLCGDCTADLILSLARVMHV